MKCLRMLHKKVTILIQTSEQRATRVYLANVGAVHVGGLAGVEAAAPWVLEAEGEDLRRKAGIGGGGVVLGDAVVSPASSGVATCRYAAELSSCQSVSQIRSLPPHHGIALIKMDSLIFRFLGTYANSA